MARGDEEVGGTRRLPPERNFAGLPINPQINLQEPIPNPKSGNFPAQNIEDWNFDLETRSKPAKIQSLPAPRRVEDGSPTSQAANLKIGTLSPESNWITAWKTDSLRIEEEREKETGGILSVANFCEGKECEVHIEGDGWKERWWIWN